MNAEKVNQRINSMRKFMESWAQFALAESECTITITPVDGGESFQTNIYDRSFDLFIKPALQQAIRHTLELDMAFLNGVVKNIEGVLGNGQVTDNKKTTKYTCPECGGDKFDVCRTVDLNTMQFVRDITDCEHVYCFGCDKDQLLENLIVEVKNLGISYN